MSENSKLPVVSFSVDKNVIVEGGEAQILTFNLSEPAPAGGLVVNIRVDDPDGDSGPGDTSFPPELISNITDFGQVEEDGVITASLTIAEGATEATFGVAAFEDDLVEIGETYSFTLLEDENYIVDPASTTITTTIEDSMKPTVSIIPETLISTEGNTFVWNFSLDKPVPSGGLTLNLPITQNNDPAPGDVNYFVEGSTNITDFSFLTQDDVSTGFSVTLAEGVTEAKLVSEAVADDIEESDEIFTTVLADGEDYTANPDSNQVTTILTEQPVVSFTSEQISVAEGNTFVWNFSLNQPVPSGGLTLNLPITQNNDPAPGDVNYNVEGSTNITDFSFLTQDDVSTGFSVTLAEGVTEAKLVSEAVADDIDEMEEIFTTVLADGEDYRANPQSNEVVTTIVEQDSSSETPAFIQQDLYFGLNIPDGGEVSESEFQAFVDNVIAPQFVGLTQFDALGQVQDDSSILKEPSKVVTLLVEDTPENKAAVNEVLSEYQQQFAGAGVLQVANKDEFKVSFGAADDLIDNDATPELIQADLYFGRNISDGGEVSESEFQAFVEDVVAPRFAGLTQFDAQGQVRDSDGNILKESSKVVTLLLEDTQANETAINEVLELYQQQFPGTGVAQTVNEDVAVAFGVADDLIDNDATPETIQADLYFGRNIPDGGEVSEAGFQAFVDNVVALRFAGLTQFDATGQVSEDDGSILKEPSKVVTLILEDTEANESAIQEVLTAYQQLFNGAGVAQVIDEDIKVNFEPLPDNGSSVAIAIENPGFEIPQLGEDQFTQTQEGEFIPGWSVFDPAGLVGENVTDVGAFNPTSNVFPSEAPEGENTGYAYSQAPVGSGIFGLTQTLDTELKANTEYTLQVEVGNTAENNPDDGFNYEGFPGYRVELLAGGKVLARDDNSLSIAEGEFETSTVTFSAAETEPYLGQNLEIRLVNLLNGSGEDVEFDNVRLFAETVEPVLPTLSLNAEPNQVNEGEQLKFNFDLSEAAPMGGLTVNLDLVEDTDPLPGDITYFVEGSENITDFELLVNEDTGLIDGATVTIAEGATEATLLSDIIADNATEGPESVKFGLADGDYSIDSEDNAASFTIVDTSTDLKTSTSISFELDDVIVTAREAVADVSVSLDYITGTEASEFLPVGEIASFVEDYLATDKSEGDFFEVITEDLAESLVSDSGLGIGSVFDSLTVELAVEPNFVIPFPFTVTASIANDNVIESNSAVI